MSFTMYMGMIVGMVIGGLLVAVALLVAKRKGVEPLVEQDERTEQVSLRAGHDTLLAALGFSFVGWVMDNIARNAQGEPVAFISPWSLIFFAMVVVYALTWYYESWKVSDHDAAPDDKEMNQLGLAMAAVSMSFVMVCGAFAAAGDRISAPIKWFLGSFEFLMLLLIGFLFAKMYQRRRRA